MIGSLQRTLKHRMSCIGTGLHSGQQVAMTLVPADEDTGIRFFRRDIHDKNPVIIARYDNVVETTLGTTIANEDGVKVSTIEHLMAALWGCGVDNCVVELDGSELPIMDGSSEPFIFLIECAGIHVQQKERKVIEVLETIEVSDAKGGTLRIEPSSELKISLDIDFGDTIIAKQHADFNAEHLSFKTELSRARTFCFEKEVEAMRSMGLARGGSLDNAIVVGDDGILNLTGLRFKDEFVRHKILDCIGDLFLAGTHIRGAVTGYKSGHGLNNALLRSLFAQSSAWKFSAMPSQRELREDAEVMAA